MWNMEKSWEHLSVSGYDVFETFRWEQDMTLITQKFSRLCCTFNTKQMYTMVEGNGTPLQYCCLENPMDGGAWQAVVHGVPKSWTRLSDFTFTFHFHALEKEMATHSSVLAWRIPWTEKPGRGRTELDMTEVTQQQQQQQQQQMYTMKEMASWVVLFCFVLF